MDLGLPPKPSRESLVAMCRDEPERAADLILMLWGKVEQLAAIVEEQGEEIAVLKAKLGKDSHNSSKPPSSDRHNPGGSPPKGAGKRGRKKKPGAQPGHKGTTLRKSKAPDHVVDLPPPTRCSCGESLAGASPCGETQRQVFDLPAEIKVEVTEYRAPVCRCSSCGKRNTAPFPAEVKAPVQYGERIRAAATYLHVYHLLPYERLAGLFADLFGCKSRASACSRATPGAASTTSCPPTSSSRASSTACAT
ncbi:MAG: hypothetical protein GY946_11630, partial [bacterium]|nr:hypothetical protein [bacterium]